MSPPCFRQVHIATLFFGKHSTQTPTEDPFASSHALRASMAAYVSPAHQASLAEMARIEAAALVSAPVLKILHAQLSAMIKDVNKSYTLLESKSIPGEW